jgi:hypothetical protein
MSAEFRRNLGLAASVSILCLWAFAAVEKIPYLSSPLVLLVAIDLQKPFHYWNQRVEWSWNGVVFPLLALAAIAGGLWLLAMAIPRDAFMQFVDSPVLILVVWACCVWGVVAKASRLTQTSPNYSSKPTP